MTMSKKKELPPKEAALFKQILRQYEHKQYKKGLKVAEQILKKVPDHGETLSMKGLFLNHLDNKDEAYENVKKGLRCDLMSPVCWHVYGLLYRSDKNYEEAMKCYKNALKYDKENVQVLRDYSILQIQMRNYEGFNETQHQLLKLRPNQRAFWIALAISYQLLDNHEMAIKVLDAYAQTVKERSDDSIIDYEQSELSLYKNMLYQEMGDYKEALKHLDAAKKDVCDKMAWKHNRAKILLKLNRNAEAEVAFAELLKLNPERSDYVRGLVSARQVGDDEQKLIKCYEELLDRHPRSTTIVHMLLSALQGVGFERQLSLYLQNMLRKGVPSIFVLIKELYKNPEKARIIESVVTGFEKSLHAMGKFVESATDSEPPSSLLWVMYFLAQHFDFLGDSVKAADYIDKVLEHTPTLLEGLMMKARIYKHAGNSIYASRFMDEARQLDLQDRFINSKATKYLVRNDDIDAAEKTIALFAKQGDHVEKMNDLVEMQCMWFAIECGMSYYRQGKFGPALKKFHQIFKHFEDIADDQFDFHTYCLRKMTLRPYVDLLKFEDRLREHPYYYKAAILAIDIYISVFDNPALAKTEEIKDQPKPSAKNDGKKTDDDPSGEKLLSTNAPLDVVSKLLAPLQDLCFKEFKVHHLSCKLYIRRKKPLMALKALQHAEAFLAHPDLVLVRAEFWSFIFSAECGLESLEPRTRAILEKARDRHDFLKNGMTSLQGYVRDVLAKTTSASELISAFKALWHLDKKSYEQENVVKDLARIPGLLKPNKFDIDIAISGYTIIQGLNVPNGLKEKFRSNCASLFPLSNHFMTEAALQESNAKLTQLSEKFENMVLTESKGSQESVQE